MQIDTSKMFSNTTLGELENTLPVFRLDAQKKPIKDLSFNFISWDMEMEDKISSVYEKSKNIGMFVNEMFGLLLSDFCGQNFQAMSEEQRLLTINQLEFPNVMYMYIYLRVEELGHELAFDKITCPHCRTPIENFIADLRTLTVHIKEYDFEKDCPVHDRLTTYELARPFSFNDQPITGFELDVSKWDYMERVDKPKTGESVTSSFKKTMLVSSISGFYNGEDKISKFFDPKEVIKKMKKIDIERCMSYMAHNNAGVDMQVSGDCPHCDQTFHRLLDWSYENFFDSSSL